MKDCPMISSSGRVDKQVAPSAPKDEYSMKTRYHSLRSRREKPYESDDDVGKFFSISLI